MTCNRHHLIFMWSGILRDYSKVNSVCAMNIDRIVEQNFEGKCNQYRVLRGDSKNGVLACGFVHKNRKSGSTRNLSRDQYDLLLVLSGEGTYIDDIHGEIPLRPGDCVQRLPDRKHSTIIGSDDWRELYMCLGSEIFHSLATVYVGNEDKPVLRTGLDFELIQLYTEIHRQLDCLSREDLPLVVPKYIELITRATYLDRLNEYTSEEVNVLRMSVSYIKEHIHQRLSVEDVANHINMGYEKYRKLFLRHYGVSPGNYILAQRIREAQKLLGDHELSIKEIALSLGYSDAYTFSKQFKKSTGHTPSRFRSLYH